MENVLKYLESINPLRDELKEYLSQSLKCKVFKKNEFLLKEGQICRNIYFIEAGLLRCFFWGKNREICSWFMMDGDIAIAVRSFLKQIKSYESIEALAETTVHYITYEELKLACTRFPEFNATRADILAKYYLLDVDNLYSMRKHSATEKYQYLLENYPLMIKRIHSSYISSYLGVTQQHLCLIKRACVDRRTTFNEDRDLKA